MKLAAIMIGTDNAPKLGEFWTKILGEPGWKQDGWFGFEGGVMIGPHSEVSGKNADSKRLILNLEVTDIQGEFDRIKAIGAEVVAEPYAPNPEQPEMLLATFADPDGNYFQLAPPWKD